MFTKINLKQHNKLQSIKSNFSRIEERKNSRKNERHVKRVWLLEFAVLTLVFSKEREHERLPPPPSQFIAFIHRMEWRSFHSDILLFKTWHQKDVFAAFNDGNGSPEINCEMVSWFSSSSYVKRMKKNSTELSMLELLWASAQ